MRRLQSGKCLRYAACLFVIIKSGTPSYRDNSNSRSVILVHGSLLSRPSRSKPSTYQAHTRHPPSAKPYRVMIGVLTQARFSHLGTYRMESHWTPEPVRHPISAQSSLQCSNSSCLVPGQQPRILYLLLLSNPKDYLPSMRNVSQQEWLSLTHNASILASSALPHSQTSTILPSRRRPLSACRWASFDKAGLTLGTRLSDVAAKIVGPTAPLRRFASSPAGFADRSRSQGENSECFGQLLDLTPP